MHPISATKRITGGQGAVPDALAEAEMKELG
jgi:hypothetical protein